jgi:hypothetical protein
VYVVLAEFIAISKVIVLFVAFLEIINHFVGVLPDPSAKSNILEKEADVVKHLNHIEKVIPFPFQIVYGFNVVGIVKYCPVFVNETIPLLIVVQKLFK